MGWRWMGITTVIPIATWLTRSPVHTFTWRYASKCVPMFPSTANWMWMVTHFIGCGDFRITPAMLLLTSLGQKFNYTAQIENCFHKLNVYHLYLRIFARLIVSSSTKKTMPFFWCCRLFSLFLHVCFGLVREIDFCKLKISSTFFSPSLMSTLKMAMTNWCRNSWRRLWAEKCLLFIFGRSIAIYWLAIQQKQRKTVTLIRHCRIEIDPF